MAFTKATFDYLDSGGLINWQTTAKTSNFPAVSGEGYLVDTSSAAITVTLPTSPSAGDEIIIVDYASNAGTNNITLDPGTLNLRGATDDFVMSNNNQSARLLYSGATKGWLVTSDAGAAAAVAPALEIDYLVVAGGGGGGAELGGGGGAGGLRTSYTNSSSLAGHTETSLTLSTLTNYTVSVGPGGAGSIAGSGGNASNGTNSVFSTITSTGGGYGGRDSSSYYNGGSGGSGGGGAFIGTNGSAVTSPVVHGYNGGVGSQDTPNYGAGGGGGANSVGGNGSGTAAGNGGNGLEVNIIGGTGNYYAGGGGGGTYATSSNSGGTAGTGGIGGGGDGTNTNTVDGENGTPNTGGGGGGGYKSTTSSDGGTGGSGVVILKYPDAYTISETTSPTVLTFTTDAVSVSGYKITTFTAGESGTIQFST